MAMSTPTLDESARLLSAAVLIDTVQIYTVGDPVTVGTHVERTLVSIGQPVPGLVQHTGLNNAVESRVDTVYSIKVSRYTVLEAGMAVRVITCQMDPSLVSKVLLVDKVSKNGLALLRKGIASEFETVNQEGKEDLS